MQEYSADNINRRHFQMQVLLGVLRVNGACLIYVLIFFIQAYIVGSHLNYLDNHIKAYDKSTHLNCLDLSRQFKCVSTIYAIIEK